MRGRENLKKYIDGMSGPATRHILTDFVIEGDGDTATAKYYWWVYQLTDAAPKLILTCVCNAKLVKVDGQWKFKEVALSFDRTYY